jgi:hypothetical protein
MAGTVRTEVDVARAKQFWAEYQKSHDVSDRIGQAVGIDPDAGEVHFGQSASEVARRLSTEGCYKPLFFMRVGYDYYLKKVGKRVIRRSDA